MASEVEEADMSSTIPPTGVLPFQSGPRPRAGCRGRPAGRLLKLSYEKPQNDDKPCYSQDSSKCVGAIEGL